jgi:deoxyguanosine kinase
MVYIALGSNIGNRFVLLQKAVDCIGSRIGTILSVSKVYETPAWGFESGAFLNACIKIKTDQTALDVLDVLLTIENDTKPDRSIWIFCYSIMKLFLTSAYSCLTQEWNCDNLF